MNNYSCATELIMKYFLISICLTITIIACSKSNKVVVKGEKSAKPILKMEMVEIPSQGKVYKIEGSAEIKKDGAAGYSVVIIGTAVESDDILWIKKGAIVGIKFNDNSYVINEPQDEDKFICFNKV